MAIAQRWILGFGICVSLAAGALLWISLRQADAASAAPSESYAQEDEAAPHIPPAATPAAREARRMRRYDRNKDHFVSYEEYMVSRRKAFAKLDSNQDGRLSFEEYAVKTTEKFNKADSNGDQRLDAKEFAATATRKSGSD